MSAKSWQRWRRPSTRRPRVIHSDQTHLELREAPNVSSTLPDHYQLLEVPPHASDEELRRAYKGLLERYDPKGIVAYGLYSEPQLHELTQRITEAYHSLVDPNTREQYDLDHFPEGVPDLPVQSKQRKNSYTSRVQPLIPPDTDSELISSRRLDGPTLRIYREQRDVSLEAIYERTKISVHKLAALEAHRYEELPSEVYLKGFLKQVALVLSLDPEKLTKDYLESYHAWQLEQE